MGFIGEFIKSYKNGKESVNQLSKQTKDFFDYVDSVFKTQHFLNRNVAIGINERADVLLKEASAILHVYFSSKKTLEKNKTEIIRVIQTIDNRITEHNDMVADMLVSDARSKICPVEGKTLDNQQLRCIVKPMANHLVIAGAGTGKTTTIVGKVKYLLKTGSCKPEDILVLSFTNASATEMRERIHKETGLNIEASTFHKLGLNILTKVNGITPKITKIQLPSFIKTEMAKRIKDPAYMRSLCNYIIYNHKYQKSEFDFKNKQEYDEYFRMNPPVSFKNDSIKSYGEMGIANFLYQNGIKYEYEKEYEHDTRTSEYSQYYPDFYLPEYGYYIEYFGINEKGNVPDYFESKHGKTASEEYREGMEWKRNLHKKYNTKLIECYAYEKFKGSLLTNLERKLKESGVRFNPISSEEMWNEIEKRNSKNIINGIVELMGTIISLLKSNNYGVNDFMEMTKSPMVELLAPIYEAYQLTLEQNGEIDFNDMINMATQAVRDWKYENKYKYLIVDEYQDISKSRYKLLKALRDSSFYNIFCVGDDWQSIYRFSGSDMDYILNFYKYWGPTEISKIETTYRFSDSLIDISSNFVMQNPFQIKKQIRGVRSKIGFAMGEVKGYTEEYSIKFMLDKLAELPKNSSVFFLGRYTFDSKLLSDCSDLACHYDNATQKAVVKYPKRPDLQMEFMTVHKSKGLQADYVFIINNKDKGMGFPSKIQDDPLVDMLLEGKESFPFAEERRLFYVALTRAKVKSYLVVSENNSSIFAKEMEYRYESALKQETRTCPWCGGKLEWKKGPYGDFFGCSNYKITGCTFKRSIHKKNKQ